MLIPIALASLAVTGIVNLRVNHNMITDLAEKGFAIKKDKKNEFTHAVKTFSILNFIPLVNIGYTLLHNGSMYKNRDAIFGELIKKGAIERLDPTKNEALKNTPEERRSLKVLKWRIRENLGKDPITESDINPDYEGTMATCARGVTSAIRNIFFINPERNQETKRQERLRRVLSDTDEETQKMLDALIANKEADRGKSR